MSRTMPPLPPNDPFATPVFYYGAIQVVWCWYEVDLDILNGYLDALGMKPGTFGGKGLVNFSFMNATSLFGAGTVADASKKQANNPGGSTFNETELNVVAYAKARENDVPDDLTSEAFIMGADQSKNLGVYRLHVACDSPMAIAAGRAYYYENKFLAYYNYTAPNLNRTVANQLSTDNKWAIECLDADAVDAPKIYKANIDASNLQFHDANASEVIDISYDKKNSRVLGSRRNFLGMHNVAMLNDSQASCVDLNIGEPDSAMSADGKQMTEDMARLLGGRKSIAIQKFDSPTCLAEAIPYYMDQI